MVDGAAWGIGVGGADGRLLGPKISLRVDGNGEISPVDGTAENSEFCAGACAWAGHKAIATRTSPSAGHSRPHTAAVAGALSMTSLFSAQIAAISSHSTACL